MDNGSHVADEVYGVTDLLLPRNLRRPRVLRYRHSFFLAVVVVVVVSQRTFYGAESSGVYGGLRWR